MKKEPEKDSRHNELSHEEIARIFALYVGCDLQCPISQNPDCKLLLKPLLSISNEDVFDIGNSYFSDFDKEFARVNRRDGMVFLIYHSSSTCLTSINVQHYNIYMRLIQLGYAVPLFISPKHLLNGKTAIELGLAKECGINNIDKK